MENSSNLPVKSDKKLSGRFNKFVHSVKFINYISFVLIMASIVTFIFCFNTISTKQKLKNDAQANQKNVYSLYNQNQLLSSGQDIVVNEVDTSSVQLFSNGKQAAIYAFDRLYNSSTTYELINIGKTHIKASVVDRVLEFQQHNYKFSDGLKYGISFRKDAASIANQSAATETIYYQGQKYIREGKFFDNNGTFGGDFSGGFSKVNSSNTNGSFYIINSSTVQKCTSFTITKNEGKIVCYNISIELDPVNSVVNYANGISEEGGTSIPQFDYVHITLKIDSAGNMISYSVVEEMNASKTVPVLGNVAAHTKNEVETIIIGIDHELPIAEPRI